MVLSFGRQLVLALAFVCGVHTVSAVSQCDTGSYGVNSGGDWVVCEVDTTEDTIWLSHGQNGGGQYYAHEICESLGCTDVLERGGTCGDVCGYCTDGSSCSSHGNEYFSGGGGTPDPGSVIQNTVMWRCSGCNLTPTPTSKFNLPVLLSEPIPPISSTPTTLF